MSPIDVLEQEVLHTGVVARPSDNEVRLYEPNSPLKEVFLRIENSGKTLLLRIDKVKVTGLYQRGEGQLKRCDYVIFTEIGKQKYLVFIEMKHKDCDNNKIIQQFRGAECLVDYIDSVLHRFYGVKSLQEYKKRFVLFYKVPIPKQPTRPKKAQGKNDAPERYVRKVVNTGPLAIGGVV